MLQVPGLRAPPGMAKSGQRIAALEDHQGLIPAKPTDERNQRLVKVVHQVNRIGSPLVHDPREPCAELGCADFLDSPDWSNSKSGPARVLNRALVSLARTCDREIEPIGQCGEVVDMLPLESRDHREDAQLFPCSHIAYATGFLRQLLRSFPAAFLKPAFQGYSPKARERRDGTRRGAGPGIKSCPIIAFAAKFTQTASRSRPIRAAARPPTRSGCARRFRSN